MSTLRVHSPMDSPALIERLPPQNLDAERAVLGSILRDNALLDDVLLILRPDHFYTDAHQRLIKAMISLRDGSKVIDLVVLAEKLHEVGAIDDIGGYEYLAQLWDAAPTAANVQHYAAIVRDKSLLRDMIHVSSEILRDAYEQASPAQDILEQAEKKMFRVSENGVSNTTVTMKQLMSRVLDRIDERQVQTEKSRGIPTGLYDLDDKTGGWQKGELSIIAARPSAGKTAITATFAAAAARADSKVMFFSLEQSVLDIGERFLIAAAEVDSKVLRSGSIISDDVQKLVDGAHRLNDLPIWFDDRQGQTYLQIASKARQMRRRHTIDLVIIDYLQLIVSDDRRAQRHEQVAEISRRLKDLARELNIPIICLAQLNRECENRPDKRPRISDLRESGAIEQDADVVILLHRPEMYPDLPDGQKRPGEADLIIAKQRNGPTGDVPVSYQKQWMRFGNLTYGDSPT